MAARMSLDDPASWLVRMSSGILEFGAFFVSELEKNYKKSGFSVFLIRLAVNRAWRPIRH